VGCAFMPGGKGSTRVQQRMSPLTNVRLFINMAKDGNLYDKRPAWWVIVLAIFGVLYLFGH
jgi:hypothetical protein